MVEFIPFLMFLAVCLVLMAGYPVAASLAGTALLFAAVGSVTGHFDFAFLQALPNMIMQVLRKKLMRKVRQLFQLFVLG